MVIQSDRELCSFESTLSKRGRMFRPDYIEGANQFNLMKPGAQHACAAVMRYQRSALRHLITRCPLRCPAVVMFGEPYHASFRYVFKTAFFLLTSLDLSSAE